MVSVMNNNDLELDKTDPVAGRVSGDSGDVNRSGFSDLVASEGSGDGVGVGSDGVEIHHGGDAGSPLKTFGSPQSDPDSGFSVGGVSSEDKGSDRFRVFEVDDEVGDGEMKPAGSGSKPLKGVNQWGKKMDKSKVKNEEKGIVKVKKSGAPKQKNEVGSSVKGKSIVTVKSKSVGYGYQLEDQVWGKVKSHPWWPGFIYDEAFAEASVLRLKRPGHVLVAFFGDGSYGYFDPAELIPFEPHFSEKSKQSRHTAPKIFQKAVDEAIDEACRRRALGLSCRCRNPYNFRPGAVEGYMAVDVVDYEPGAVYSTSLIKEARDKFQPRDMLSFIKQSAMMSREAKPTEIDFAKDKATVLAYRKAVFEEFDETYAEAFGQTPVRPTREPVESLVPARAHLSGPMVTAEALGKKKKFAKQNKSADKGIKDAFLFKRREEPKEVKKKEVVRVTSSVQPSYGSSDIAAEDFVLQKRKPTVFPKQKTPRKQKEAVHKDESSGAPSLANGSSVEDPSSFLDTTPLKQTPSFEKGEATDSPKYSATADHTITGSSGYPVQGTLEVDAMSEDMTKVVDGSVVREVEQAPGEGSAGDSVPGTDSKFQGRQVVAEAGTKKAKLKKRPAVELVSEKSGSVEKKKKRKKDLGEETSTSPVQILGSAERGTVSVGKVSGKTVKVSLPPKDEFRIEPRKKDGASTIAAVADSVKPIAVVGTVSPDPMLSGLLRGLRCAALDPFHETAGVKPTTVRQFFLRYRSLVFQKSLPLVTTAEVESVDASASRSSAGSASDNLLRESVKDSPLPRPPRPVRADDPMKGGRKRGPSDRQEEIAAKRVKKIADAKSAALEKKTVLKNTEAKRDVKEAGPVSKQTKFQKPELTKKTAPSPRRPEPTVLLMKFPPETSLPSPSELKARLARFGPLDHSHTRVFWTSSTCRVMYRFKADAEAAHRHLVGKNTLFGQVSLRCHLRPLESVQPEPDSRNSREDAEAPRDSPVEQRGPFAPQMPSPGQLRSCLKKPVAEEPAAAAAPAAGGNGGGSSSRVGPRVKFVLGENSGGGDQTMMIGGNKNFNNSSTSFADFAGSASLSSSSPSSSSSHGIDFNSRNFQQKVIPQPPPPQPFQPPPPHFQTAPVNYRYPEAPPPRMQYFNPNIAAQALPPPPPPPQKVDTTSLPLPLPPPPPPPQKVDISGPLLRLLNMNYEVVTNVMKMPGYKPYRPL